MAHHAGETISVSTLVKKLDKQRGAIDDRIETLEELGLVKSCRDRGDRRVKKIIMEQRLFDIFGRALDELIDMMCMSVECIKKHGARRYRRKDEVEEFCEELTAICRLKTTGVQPEITKKTVAQKS
jgi:DNA-binding MarR family transcriptional regulator